MLKIDGSNLVKEFDVKTAKENIGGEIEINACVHKVRQMSEFAFVVLRTGRNLIQSVYSADNCKDSLDGIKEGCFVTVKGIVKEEARAFNGIEVTLTSIKLLSKPDYDYPLHVSHKKLGCSLDINLDLRSVALRNPYERAIIKLQEGICGGFREFMLNNNFTEIHTPKIVAQGAEGGANIFRLDYFDKEAFLNQSPQFYKQTGVAIYDRVFEIAPVYRAERHATSRHLNEYIGLDFEMGFINDMYDVMNMETSMLRYVMKFLEENYAPELSLTGTKIPEIKDIPSIKFTEAIEILGGKGGSKFDLEPEDEIKLCKYAEKEFGSEFLFITHFPAAKRPFYAMNDKEDPRTALSFDLLFRGLEITTGGQRIHDYKEQVAKMEAMGMDINDFASYLDIHKYGMPPHGGLGIGLERLLMKLVDLPNIRQASMFPRDLNRLLP